MRSFLIGLIVGAVCVFVIGFLWKKGAKRENAPKVTCVTDTDTIIDTMFRDKPVPVFVGELKKIPINLITHEDSDSISVLQKEYRDSSYIAWVSGIEPSLDSIRVFQKTKIVHETKVIETMVTMPHSDKCGVMVGVGVNVWSKQYLPKINVLYGNSKWATGVSVGILNDKPFCGVDFNFKVK